MDPFDLPPDLTDVERLVGERDRPQLPAAFRQRVLSAMHAERTPRRTIGSIVAVLAASVLLCLNLAMSLANHRAWPQMQQIDGGDIDSAVRTMRQHHPDLSEQEAYQIVVLVRLAPALSASRKEFMVREGEQLWDMR